MFRSVERRSEKKVDSIKHWELKLRLENIVKQYLDGIGNDKAVPVWNCIPILAFLLQGYLFSFIVQLVD